MNEIYHLAILSAMPEEIGNILDHLVDIKTIKYGDLKVYQGFWIETKTDRKIKITSAWSGWGKVSSARAATRIIGLSGNDLPIDLFIFTGVAGAIKSDLRQWDIVLPDKLCQYDMDARPIFEKFVIPPLNKRFIEPETEIHKWALNSLKDGIENGNLSKFRKILVGLVGTADKFISSDESRRQIVKDLPSIFAVEMEGAAFAQIVSQEEIPWLVIRVVSDTADNSAAQNFNDFLNDYSKYSWQLINQLLS